MVGLEQMRKQLAPKKSMLTTSTPIELEKLIRNGNHYDWGGGGD